MREDMYPLHRVLKDDQGLTKQADWRSQVMLWPWRKQTCGPPRAAGGGGQFNAVKVLHWMSPSACITAMMRADVGVELPLRLGAGKVTWFVVYNRSIALGEFSDETMGLINRITPHLQRRIKLMRGSDAIRPAAASGVEALLEKTQQKALQAWLSLPWRWPASH